MNEEKPAYKDIVLSKIQTPQTEVTKAARQTLDRAWQIRNFEIELYWKRALYFWGFIAFAFTGYFSTFDKEEHTASLIIACSGLVFSFAWFLVNKASKFWQENWEAHIDCLEDELEGSLYKTVLKNKSSLWLPLKGYHFSVSKINQCVNLFVCAIWMILICINPSYEDTDWLALIAPFIQLKIALPVLSLIAVVLLFSTCKTSFNSAHGFKPMDKTKYTYLDREL